jgi:hypothetical protein
MVRANNKHCRRSSTRKTDESMATSMENTTHQAAQSAMEKFVSRRYHTPFANRIDLAASLMDASLRWHDSPVG